MTKQVHVFGSLGAPVFPLRWITNPTEQGTSNRAREIQPSKGNPTEQGSLGAPVFVTQRNRRNRRNRRKQEKASCVPAHIRTQERFLKNYCYYCYSVTNSSPLRRICNPTASSISICNALINNQKTKNIFTHLKCLYSLRLDCKSNRAREQVSLGAPVFVTQRNRRNPAPSDL